MFNLENESIGDCLYGEYISYVRLYVHNLTVASGLY